jgi:dihydropteroate synthase
VASSTIFPLDRVTIVAVLNLTPDSFSDGGRFVDGGGVRVEGAVETGMRLLEEGAHVLDIGGESTRPGALDVSIDEEIERVVPVLEALAKATDAPLSVDTRKAPVAEAALAAGARVVNDVSGLGYDLELAGVAARSNATLVLGHLRGVPATMQVGVRFVDVVREVTAELAGSVRLARVAGVRELVVDPGIGFGKRLADNLTLLARVGEIRDRLGLPVLVGPSRKAFLGEITGDPVQERDRATLAACSAAVFAGADAIRVHEVAGARRAALVGRALREARP